jgi:hypothetical protein
MEHQVQYVVQNIFQVVVAVHLVQVVLEELVAVEKGVMVDQILVLLEQLTQVVAVVELEQAHQVLAVQES